MVFVKEQRNQQKINDFTKVSLGKESVGDIISLNIKGLPVHVGVVLQKGLMLHIMDNEFAKIESYYTSKWKDRINSFWRYEDTLQETNI